MYEIRFYYKNNDDNCKEKILYHSYNGYKSFEEAYREMICLIKQYDILIGSSTSMPFFFVDKKGTKYVVTIEAR